MRKELIFAIVIGIALGLFITYGVYYSRLALSRPAPKPTTEEATADADPLNADSEQLTIYTPEDETVQEDKNLNITGTTLPNNFVVIFVNNAETISSADQNGNFSAEVELEDGSNVISVYVLDEDGQSYTQERTVIVSNDPLTGVPAPAADTQDNQEATPEANT